VTFSSHDCPPQAIEPYLNHLLAALVTCLQGEVPPQVQEKALQGEEEEEEEEE